MENLLICLNAVLPIFLSMAQQMGGDAEFVGDTVVSTSPLCSFTLFGWSFLFKTLGFF